MYYEFCQHGNWKTNSWKRECLILLFFFFFVSIARNDSTLSRKRQRSLSLTQRETSLIVWLRCLGNLSPLTEKRKFNYQLFSISCALIKYYSQSIGVFLNERKIIKGYMLKWKKVRCWRAVCRKNTWRSVTCKKCVM